MKPVDLAELRAQYLGSRFCQLIEHQLRRQTQKQRMEGLHGIIEMLPKPARLVVEGFIDQWNARAYDPIFWQSDTALVFDEIITDARRVLSPTGLSADDEAAFNMFNIVVLNYAYSAYDEPKMRQFMRIADSRTPWPSAVALLYPIIATIYIAGWTPAGPAMVVGYGLANLWIYSSWSRHHLGYLSSPRAEEPLAGFLGSCRFLRSRNRADEYRYLTRNRAHRWLAFLATAAHRER